MSLFKDAKPGEHGFVSEIDKFLLDFNNQRQEFPSSMVAEIQKHKSIAKKRDTEIETSQTQIWQDF